MLRYKSIVMFVFIPVFAVAYIQSRDSLLQKLYTTYDPKEKIKVLNLLFDSWISYDPEKAYNMAREALQLAETFEDNEGKAQSLYSLAIYAFKQNDMVTASYLLNQSLAVFVETDNTYGQAKVTLALGKVFSRKFEYEKSLEMLLTATEIFQEYGDNVKLAEAYNSIGGIYYDQADYEKAFEYFRNSLFCWEKEKDTSGLAVAYNNIGEIYRLKGQINEAMVYYRKAVPINKVINRYDNLA
ncbi:MAG: tetratricopeptide repeat protein, partial [Bacteroidetes bacterium]|nr:tetratricopeptide repeat protein [Bacteroidota bacterium]